MTPRSVFVLQLMDIYHHRSQYPDYYVVMESSPALHMDMTFCHPVFKGLGYYLAVSVRPDGGRGQF